MFKIALVEDDHTLSSMYKFKLSSHGYAVECAYDGLEGLELVENITPDLVLLDLRMPRMTGDEMLAKMRATEWGSQPRVIILTNISRDEAPSALRFLNVDRYLVKAHHTPAQIVDVVHEVLHGRKKPAAAR